MPIPMEYNLTEKVLKGLLPQVVGKVLFVSSVYGNSNAEGSLYNPFSSIQTAFAYSGLAYGDAIVSLPGHTETITSAAGTALSVAGVRVIALGTGTRRATLNFTTATTASLKVTAANCSLEGFYVNLTSVDALANPIHVDAADFQMINCEILQANATNQAVYSVLTTANADRMRITNCFFHGSSDAGATAAIGIVGGDSIVIENCKMIGAYTAGIGGINQITTTTTNCFVVNNLINNLTASSTKAMVFTASSTGMISNNRMQILSGTAPITGAAMSWVGGNYYAATIATAGTLV